MESGNPLKIFLKDGHPSWIVNMIQHKYPRHDFHGAMNAIKTAKLYPLTGVILQEKLDVCSGSFTKKLSTLPVVEIVEIFFHSLSPATTF